MGEEEGGKGTHGHIGQLLPQPHFRHDNENQLPNGNILFTKKTDFTEGTAHGARVIGLALNINLQIFLLNHEIEQAWPNWQVVQLHVALRWF